ncbi:MAG TPA: ATPase domain-containing protein [Nitrosopumilaceae archaeon]|nr:ATPase domain-containing protein [Nitrosopumilaceae archaeon]
MIPTGIKKLDDILGGGIKNGIITDIHGAAGTGKTQLAMQIAINSVLEGGLVFFHDTTGNFRPERMLEMLKAKNYDYDILQKIQVARITNVSEQKQNLKKIQKNNYSLIIIDNIAELFSFEFSKDSQLLEKNTLFMKYMHDLALLAIEKNIPIIITNGIRHFDNTEKEILEKAVSMFTHVKIKLTKNEKSFTGKVSTAVSQNDFNYLISSNGLEDSS